MFCFVITDYFIVFTKQDRTVQVCMLSKSKMYHFTFICGLYTTLMLAFTRSWLTFSEVITLLFFLFSIFQLYIT